jgi:hypothetical protein
MRFFSARTPMRRVFQEVRHPTRPAAGATNGDTSSACCHTLSTKLLGPTAHFAKRNRKSATGASGELEGGFRSCRTPQRSTRQGVSRKPISVEVKDEADGRFVIRTYANNEVIRERVDPKKKPTRRPRRPPTKLGLEVLDKTRRKRI